MAQRNYLNNKDLLKQIHLSKQTYCAYTHDKFRDYDLIVAEHVNCIDIEDLTDENKEEAITNRKKRLQIDKDIEVDVDPNDIVYRVYDFTHIPLEPGRKNKPKTIADHHAKVNFPPFKHYAYIGDELKEVVRSHWKGGLVNGHFTTTAGQITNKLGTMFLKLVERYSHRANWRGYTYVDEMRGQALVQLAQIGLQFNEAKSDNPFAYYTAAVNNSFTRILNLEKRNQTIRDDILIDSGHLPSYGRQIQYEEEMRQMREAAQNDSES